MPPLRRWCRTGVLVPFVILLFGVAEAGLRLLPLRFLAYRAWEGLLHGDDPTRPFEPNQHIHTPRTYGDLASLANRPDLREYRVEDFTTDALGFRNPPDLLGRGPISVLVSGNSFAVAPGVSDDQTLGARLRERLGLGVYTIGGNPTPRVGDLALLLPRLHMRHGVVVQVFFKYEILPPDQQETPAYRLNDPPRSPILENLAISRVSILAEQLKQWMRPQWHQDGIVVRTLRNGDKMLFPAGDLERYADDRPVHDETWRWLKGRLEQEGLELLVVLVPTKYDVYAPLLKRPPAPRRVRPLDRLAEALRADGVPAVNLAPVFEARAAEEIEQGRYLYWKDDTHWNPLGIDIAAEEIAKAWPRDEAGAVLDPGAMGPTRP